MTFTYVNDGNLKANLVVAGNMLILFNVGEGSVGSVSL